MLTKVMARELTSKGVTVFSISPNRLAGTGMSKTVDTYVKNLRGFTEEEMVLSQKTYLTTGFETPPHVVADFIKYLLKKKENHFYLAGCDIQYGD
jgi:NAD(P)-dependent dehydrogenase (short-subunit alcohol dehydrogenase family)